MSTFKEKIISRYDRINRALHSSRGKDVLLYLMFVVVASVFWLLLSLDNEVQRDFDIPVELTDVPDSVTLIGTPPQSIGVSVKSKGSQIVRFIWGSAPVLKIKYDPMLVRDNRFFMSHARLDARLREYFGAGVMISSLRPDSISLPFTTGPGKRVKLDIKADVHPSLQCIISGPVRANVDSVTLYSTGDIPRSLTSVETDLISKSDLKDTMRYEVRIKPLPGIRIIPDKVIVTVPVEPLISKKRSVAVSAINVPDGVGLITFPSKVEVSYLVAISDYNEDLPLKAYVDYESIRQGSSYLPVIMTLAPDIYHNISLSPDSVEYIIEQKLSSPR